MSVQFTLARYIEEEGRTVLSHESSDFDVDCSNANALAVLERLGYDVSEWGIIGHATPDDFLGRALVGNVGRDDSGVDAVETPGEWSGGGATMVDCGRRPGYFDDVLGRLVVLATEAQRREVMVGWA